MDGRRDLFTGPALPARIRLKPTTEASEAFAGKGLSKPKRHEAFANAVIA